MKMEIGMVSTKTKLPRNGQVVLVVPKDPDLPICKATYFGAPDYCFDIGVSELSINQISHWAELPQNPNKKLQIGKAIKAARNMARMSQSTLAKRSGVSQVSISKYESGKMDPQFSSVAAIAEALEISVSELASMIDKCCEE